MIERLRLRLARWLCPEGWRLIEVGWEDYPGQKLPMATLRSDLIRGGDALACGAECDPAVLYNAAAGLTVLIRITEAMEEARSKTY